MDTYSLSKAGISGKIYHRRKLHDQHLRLGRVSEEVVIDTQSVEDQFKNLLCSHPCMTRNLTPETLGDFYTRDLYVWDSRAIRAMCFAASPQRAASAASNASVMVRRRESTAEDVVQVPFEDYVTGKKIAVRPFYSQIYRREELWLLVFQVEKMRNPLCIVSRKHENALLESLRSKRTSAVLG